MPDQDHGPLPELRRGGVPAIPPELVPAEAPPVPSVGERMAQLTVSDLADGAPDDADEALFDAAFGGMDGVDPEAGEAGPRIAAPPVCAPPDEVLAVVAAAGNGGPVPLLPGPEGGPPPAADRRRALGMLQISELDGYLDRGRTGQSVRALGRMIFGRLPCFVRLSEMSRRAGQDPLGQVWLMTTLSSMQPRTGPGRGELAVPGGPAGNPARARIDALAAWVRGPAGGILVDAAVLRFAAMPGYSANVMLYATEGHTYLLVEERQRNGAPVTALYAYSFPGGMQIYRQGDNARRPLERLGAPDADGRRQITVEHMPVPPAAGAGPVPALPAPRQEAAVVRPGQHPQPGQGQARPAAAPAPAAPQMPPAMPPRGPRADGAAPRAAPRSNAIQEFRAAGFLPCGTPDGPALQRQTPDGGSVLILGDGRSLALAARFSVRSLGPDGSEVERETADGAEAALEWADARAGTAPRP